ncbi:uncharacterized protein BT62DRAFT_1070846 [Guyanagaster necrorhizus]|uniref:Uncharacterized protein n=1 Tax=Guyanagaster necrorhizus TaxID=856835 RepID=A0A9P7W8B4_9AGAR|nr:uncharacterized protein BT62DRAFT_1070846 [Guyanagaster necrorhizus MCA 3950]KAG7453191.1 hypothetical protein BT62DRAFT_1070846 [Guyanagaster necrorhizus MCA 3950]
MTAKPFKPSKTPYTPVFYSSPFSSSMSSSVASGHRSPSIYLDQLSQYHLALAGLEEIPASDCGTDFDDDAQHRVRALRDRVIEALEYSNGDPADGKWSRLKDLLRLRSTTAGKRWIGVRADGLEASPGPGGFLLVDTEEQWFEWEKRREAEKMLKSKVENWQKDVIVHADPTLDDMEPLPGREKSRSKSKENAEVDVPAAKSNSKGASKTDSSATNAPKSGDIKDPSPLGFNVSKRRGATKKRPSAAPKDKSDDIYAPGNGDVSMVSAAKINISDVSETAFFPPSFPTGLETSTPPDLVRKKPPPIILVPSSSPSSSPNTKPPPLSTDISTSPERSGTHRRQASSPIPGLTLLRQHSTTPDRPSKRMRAEPPSSGSSNITPQLEASPLADLVARKHQTATPTTPQAKPLPTLSELLASAKKTPKGRGRVFSKPRSPVKAPVPIVPEEPVNVDPDPDPDLYLDMEVDLASPAKSLSSIADEDSDGGEDGVGGALPDFTYDAGAFKPPFASTQLQGSQLGYNSQVDVERNVNELDKFLARDVDMSGDEDDDVFRRRDGDVDYATWLKPEVLASASSEKSS